MAIKPSPTIAGKLRKLFNNNKQTIEPAMGDSVPGGGANALTLYVGENGANTWGYKNPERTEKYQSYDEARGAVVTADIIKIIVTNDEYDSESLFAVGYYAEAGENHLSVVVKYFYDGNLRSLSLVDSNVELVEGPTSK